MDIVPVIMTAIESERAKWLAAVEEVRERYPPVHEVVWFALDEVVRLATERKEAK